MSCSEVAEMRDYLGHAVNARRHLGKAEAVFQVAREIGIPPGRVIKILRGDIRRVWADEFRAAQRWYRDLCERQAAACEFEAERYRQRRAEIVEKLR